MRLRYSLCSLIVVIGAAIPVFRALAQDGSYDTSFGDGGRTWIDVSSSASDEANKLIRLPNGGFFMAGGCGTVACAAWLTYSGALATGYGTSGTGTTVFSDLVGWPSDALEVIDAAAFPDGRVAVVVSRSASGAYIALLHADGTALDASVGNGAGYVSTTYEAQLVRVTSQQQLIVAGPAQTTPVAMLVARYDSTFHLDTSFGNSGLPTIGFTDGDFSLNGLTLQKDGKIVAIGVAGSSIPTVGIVRLTAVGAADTTFGIDSDGRFESTLGNTYGAYGYDIVQDKQGRLVFAGIAVVDQVGGGSWLVDRLLSGGAADAGFNGGHPQQFTIASSSNSHAPHACCVALQGDNRIVIAGTMDRDVPSSKYFAIARLMDDGSFDLSFGGGGQSYGDMSPEAPNVVTDVPVSMVIVPGGIVVGGYTQVTSYETRFSATKEKIDLLFADDFE